MGICLVVGAQLCAATAMASAPAYWRNTGYTAVNEDKDLVRALQRFAENFGVTLEISGKLMGQVNEQSSAQNAVAYLDRLGLTHGFSWFVFNNILYVSVVQENNTARIKVSQDAIGEVKSAVKGLGLLEEKFGWGEIPANGLVLVSGPKKYIELVRQVIRESFEGKGRERRVMLFPLRYAWADDRRIKLRDREVVIPGVASVLRKISGAGPMLGDIGNMAPSVSKGASAGGTLVGGGLDNSAADAASAAGGGGGTRVEADVSSNSILIYDEARRRGEYAALIARLDVMKKMIETQLLIVDVERKALDDLQERWRNPSYLAKIAQQSVATETLTPSEYRKFFLELRDLEKKGLANILSSPSLTSMSEQPAVIDITEGVVGDSGGVSTSGGAPVGGLGTSSAGTSGKKVGTYMYYNARAIEGKKQLGSRMDEPDVIAISIEVIDDQIDHTANDIGPHQRNTQLNTRVFIRDGYALLLGGHHLRVSEPRSQKIRERLVFLTPSVTQFTQRVVGEDLLPQDGYFPFVPPKSDLPMKKTNPQSEGGNEMPRRSIGIRKGP